MSAYLIVSVVSATIGMAIGVSIFEASWAVASVSYLIGGWAGMIVLAAISVLNKARATRTASQTDQSIVGATVEDWLEEYDPNSVEEVEETASWETTLPHKRAV